MSARGPSGGVQGAAGQVAHVWRGVEQQRLQGRVAGGVHFPRDVIAGALIGIGCGVIGYYVILPLL